MQDAFIATSNNNIDCVSRADVKVGLDVRGRRCKPIHRVKPRQKCRRFLFFFTIGLRLRLLPLFGDAPTGPSMVLASLAKEKSAAGIVAKWLYLSGESCPTAAPLAGLGI